MINETFDYVTYLDIKKAIDDRSLNPEVWQTMQDWVNNKGAHANNFRILEIGAGIGTMIERLLDNFRPQNLSYNAVEPEPGFMPEAKKRLQRWATANALKFNEEKEDSWTLSGSNHVYRINWIVAEAEQLDTLLPANSCDLLIAHAVVDLLPVPVLMPRLLDKLNCEGAFYLSLNYAGETSFNPEHKDDRSLLQSYNLDMDKRHQSVAWQASQTGKMLGPWLREHGHQVLSEGSSDWLLGPEEGDFIENILDTINKALQGEKELTSWYRQRCLLLAQKALFLKITNTDYFGLK